MVLRHQRITGVVAIFAAILAGAADARAQSATHSTERTTMIVLDGSGSMGAKAEGSEVSKIDVVRGKLADIVRSANQSRIGLASFGHRRRGDCSDTELMHAPDADKSAVSSAIDQFGPRGKGPLVSAFELATGALPADGPANIVIINDGADNCKRDACLAASEFAARRPGVPIHMLAIGVGPIHKSRLECMPATTGGQYIEARTEPEIIAALDQLAAVAGLTAKAAAPTAAAAPDKVDAPTPAADGAALKAYIVLKAGGTIVGTPVQWTIRNRTSKAVVAKAEGSAITAQLQPGDYTIEAETADFSVSTQQTLARGDALSLAIPLNAARLKSTTRRKAGDAVSQTALIAVEPATGAGRAAQSRLGNARISHSGELETLMLPGDYVVTTVEGPIRLNRKISLAAGADETVDFVLDSGTLKISAHGSEQGPPLQDVTFVITTDDPDQPNGRREVARSSAATPEFPLPAGTYYVEARVGQNSVSKRFAVSAGETTQDSIIIPLVPITLKAVVGTTPATAAHGISYRISSLDAGGREVGRYLTPTVSMRLTPGHYRAEARLAANHISAETAFTLEPGTTRDVEITIPAANLRLSLAEGPTLVSDTFWEITDASGNPVWRNTDPSPTAIVSPGRYTISFESRTRRLKADVEVASGDDKSVVLGATPIAKP